MARRRCRECGGVYETEYGGTPYYHACPPERIKTHAVEVAGVITVPEVREPWPNRRDENLVFDPATRQHIEKNAGAGFDRL